MLKKNAPKSKILLMNQLIYVLEKNDLGYQIFNAGNDHNGAIIPSKELTEQFFPGVPLTPELEEHEALFSN